MKRLGKFTQQFLLNFQEQGITQDINYAGKKVSLKASEVIVSLKALKNRTQKESAYRGTHSNSYLSACSIDSVLPLKGKMANMLHLKKFTNTQMKWWWLHL